MLQASFLHGSLLCCCAIFLSVSPPLSLSKNSDSLSQGREKDWYLLTAQNLVFPRIVSPRGAILTRFVLGLGTRRGEAIKALQPRGVYLTLFVKCSFSLSLYLYLSRFRSCKRNNNGSRESLFLFFFFCFCSCFRSETEESVASLA